MTNPVTGLELSTNEANLTSEGDTLQLRATISPANATYTDVTWSSSNTESVTVDENGLATAIANGTATITATSHDGECSASCKVTVDIPAVPVPVTDVALSRQSLALTRAGENAKLEAMISPENADNTSVVWSSSDGSVATVSGEGVVTAIDNGSATITATTVDGGFTTTCEVVVSIPRPVTGISLDETSLTLTSEGETGKLVATVQPEDADNADVVWSSPDESVAEVAMDGVVTAVSNGTATITAKTVDGGYEATRSVTVDIPKPPVLATGIRLYPTVAQIRLKRSDRFGRWFIDGSHVAESVGLGGASTRVSTTNISRLNESRQIS